MVNRSLTVRLIVDLTSINVLRKKQNNIVVKIVSAKYETETVFL